MIDKINQFSRKKVEVWTVILIVFFIFMFFGMMHELTIKQANKKIKEANDYIKFCDCSNLNNEAYPDININLSYLENG